MDDPSWSEHGFAGGIRVGAPWAALKKARVIETVLRTDGLTDLRVVEVT
jgi:hypothetical protein